MKQAPVDWDAIERELTCLKEQPETMSTATLNGIVARRKSILSWAISIGKINSNQPVYDPIREMAEQELARRARLAKSK